MFGLSLLRKKRWLQRVADVWVYVSSIRPYRDFTALMAYVCRGRAEVLFYCQHPFQEEWIRTTFEALSAQGFDCRLVLTHASQPLQGYPLDRQYLCSWPVVKWMRSDLLVTAVSGASRGINRIARRSIHMLHSLVSLHQVYPDAAFDHYHYLFVAAEQHLDEVKAFRRLRPGFMPQALHIGYGKSDILATTTSISRTVGSGAWPGDQGAPSVVIAPSWGASNILELVGIELIDLLLNRGYRVLCRPHPAFFLKSSLLIQDLISRFGPQSLFELENSTATGSSADVYKFLSADLMISDYSGIALEYAFATLRPVVFVDVEPKRFNSDSGSYGLIPIEVSMREHLGLIAEPRAEGIVDRVQNCLRNPERFESSIRAARNRACINYGHCGPRAAEAMIAIHQNLKRGS